ncbi:hypothetical protein BO71DRAFT_226392 [Aspergillus ellipticus CBS 707.79]|uniref:Uncharacterized protein n=1 Tax=Aspergillus ellipticus CBS 707.79 TaxID=1448320 RepID=A0A319DBL4_9EURO|nr:hypothetical protein BO71DRAFT_226392 [Aspergillus ellipticus CBS 707.79]
MVAQANHESRLRLGSRCLAANLHNCNPSTAYLDDTIPHVFTKKEKKKKTTRRLSPLWLSHHQNPPTSRVLAIPNTQDSKNKRHFPNPSNRNNFTTPLPHAIPHNNLLWYTAHSKLTPLCHHHLSSIQLISPLPSRPQLSKVQRDPFFPLRDIAIPIADFR